MTNTTLGGTAGSTAFITMSGDRRYLFVILEDNGEQTWAEVNLSLTFGSHYNHASADDDVRGLDVAGYFNKETDLIGTTQFISVIVEDWTTGGINANNTETLISNNCQLFAQGDGDVRYTDTSAAADCAFAYYYRE